MGDRNNPIKFGPEWLRNMSRERSDARSTNNSQNTNSGSAAATASGAAAASTTGSMTATSTTTSCLPKILLAKLRYGREEMLALYDRNSEAPSELKVIDTLYQPRGKQPVALNSTFEDDMRDNLLSFKIAPPVGGMSSSDRFSGLGRGAGRGVVSDGRGRGRGAYVRTQLLGRGAHYVSKSNNPRMPYAGGADDDPNFVRLWNNNNASNSNRNSGDQTEWASKMFRSKRQGTNTNWRQPQSREDGEEWRSSEPGRSRQIEKWERDWGDRPSGEKSQSWSTNRRTWVGGDSQNNEENLPEWAAESAECGGTFDSSGAFHGYSNDDTNLPKHQESSYSLTRSHTHGSFPRPKAVEEGSEEWWASEKAKKLSPKRFDASDIKFKKQSGIDISDVGTSTNNKTNIHKEEQSQEAMKKNDSASVGPEPPESNIQPSVVQQEEKYNQNIYKSKFAESKTFDALMRSDIKVEEANDERGNFQSVIIASNNSLRQKHQHMVMAPDGQKHIRINFQGKSMSEIDTGAMKTQEDLLVDNIFGMTMDDEELLSSSLSNTGLSSDLSQNQKQNIPMSMSNSTLNSLTGMSMEMHMKKQNMQVSGMQPGHQMPGMQTGMMSAPNMQKVPGIPMPSQGLQNSGLSSGVMQSSGMSNSGMPQVGLQNTGLPPGVMQNTGLSSQGMNMQRVQQTGMPPVMQSVGITNAALNASLGLPIGPGANIGLPLQGVPQQIRPNVCVANNMTGPNMGVMGSPSIQVPSNMPGYQSSGGIPGISSNNHVNSSLFLGQNNPNMSSPNDMSMSNPNGPNNMFPMHGLQHSGSQNSFANSIYSNNSQTNINLSEQWYYEDPERNIQGPFSSKEMYNWYRAGFFSPRLMVRRACETMMRPLGSYGHVVPFVQMDMMPPFPQMSGGFESRPQPNHENMLNSQSSLGLDVDSLWGQPSSGNNSTGDLMWMQQPLGRSEVRVNNLPMYFWENQPSAIASNSLLPEGIPKEMKTEDQILAQLRASQNIGQPGMQQFIGEPQSPTPTSTSKPDDCFPPVQNATPNLEELHKLIQKDTLSGNSNTMSLEDSQMKMDKAATIDLISTETTVSKQPQNKTTVESKVKQIKETDKSVKNKENNITKNKSKKCKEEKKDDIVEIKSKEEEVVKHEKRSQESSPPKNKKEEKSNKKDLEREKKEWIKEGFTIVKGPEKNNGSKDNKKKAEEARAAEEIERKKKEDEKLAAEEDKKKKNVETSKKLQEQQQLQQQRQASESVGKKAPWSAVATQAMQSTNRDGLTLAEIQRLEREKKLEQMKEQQQMMQIIAQQQAAALAREQEMQAGLGWAKKKNTNSNTPGQSLTEIQAEARKQSVMAAAIAAQAQALDEAKALVVVSSPPINHMPWGNTHNGGGFWDTQSEQPQKQTKQETSKPVDQNKAKKKPTVPKKETSPALEFDNWCTTVLASWSSKIDVPTFVGFLKDIESPYEVKDYVKCYLGESKDSSDFSRQFLERRSKLLRVGMVTPSDDLCSPAMAVNPRTISGSDYQEVKGKGKKTKKNKMLKVDARILGFSVTAAEDRINVGDIDTV